jgi:hypothetical protein
MLLIAVVAAIVGWPTWGFALVAFAEATYIGLFFRSCQYRVEIVAALLFAGAVATYCGTLSLVPPFGPNIGKD